MKGGASMKSNDSVLNWSKIMGDISYSQSSPPREFIDRSSNKGLLFEDLIERLIKAMFPTETWRRTGKSYDGKKEFLRGRL